ncbi:MAG TPA: hypothetical protein PLD59_00085 [Tepidisphaeraceae bacterium]|nr:hypothetical protein [Tepidisphaeraceae bacterium]
MLIDRQSRPWIVITVVLFAVATALYVPYARSQLHGPTGSSWQGITFGIVGTAFMTFAMLLSFKKRVRTMRIGRAYWWTQGHVWLGLLAYPVILYHAGLRFGPAFGMTWWLMWLFTVIIVSGVVGVILQNIVPTKMLRELPLETIYEQAEHIISGLQAEASEIVARVAADQPEEGFDRDAIPAGGGTSTLTHATAVSKGQQVLQDFYRSEIQPFLQPRMGQSRLVSLTTAAAAFDSVRTSLPREFHEHLNDLQSIVDERRQIAHQKKMHHLLHGWLLFHVPLSFALMILSVIHIVVALRYL